jgi:hypothetical protein
MITRRMRIRRQTVSAFLHVEHEEELLRKAAAAAKDDLARESHAEPQHAQRPAPLLHFRGDG